MQNDYLYHGRIDPFDIGFTYAYTPRLANEAVVRHDCDPVAAHLLGRALNAGALFLPRLAASDSLNIHWRYTGALRDVLVDVRGDGGVRGLVNPSRLSGRADTEADIFGGGGSINVVTARDGRVLNSGTSDCALQQLTADLGYYFSISEQVESELNVMIDFTHDPEHPVALCQGLLLQALPGCDLTRFERLRNRLHGDDARHQLARPTRSDTHFEDLLNTLTKEEDTPMSLTVQEGPVPRFFCTCTEEKVRTSLKMLPAADRDDIEKKDEPIVVRCDYCNRAFEIPLTDARALWNP